MERSRDDDDDEKRRKKAGEGSGEEDCIRA